MALNFLQLFQQVAILLDEDVTNVTDVSTVTEIFHKTILQCINEAVEDVYHFNTGWRWRDVTTTINIISGTQDYTLSASIDPDNIKVVQFGSTPLNFVTQEQIDLDGGTIFGLNDLGIPNFYTIFNNVFRLPNVPIQSGVVTLRYQSNPPVLVNNTDTTGIPTKFDNTIVYLAVANVKSLQGKQDATMWFKKYQEKIGMFSAENKKFYQRVDSFTLGSEWFINETFPFGG